MDQGLLGAPRIPFASTATGEWHDGESIRNPMVWAGAISGPVRYADALDHLVGVGAETFVEIGPHPVLVGMGRRDHPEHLWIPTARRLVAASSPVAQQRHLYAALGQLARQTDVAWSAVHRGRLVVDTPTYPFERRPFWVGEET